MKNEELRRKQLPVEAVFLIKGGKGEKPECRIVPLRRGTTENLRLDPSTALTSYRLLRMTIYKE